MPMHRSADAWGAMHDVPGSRTHRVRMGPLSIFTLLATLCMAVLAVLVFCTANSTLKLSERQADAVAGMYRNERAAQEFVASLDETLAGLRAAGAASGPDVTERVASALDDACSDARRAAGRDVRAEARLEGTTVRARFEGPDGRALAITLTLEGDGTYRIDGWQTSKVHNEEEPDGQLYIAE